VQSRWPLLVHLVLDHLKAGAAEVIGRPLACLVSSLAVQVLVSLTVDLETVTGARHSWAHGVEALEALTL
jgi:hypothetical protein